MRKARTLGPAKKRPATYLVVMCSYINKTMNNENYKKLKGMENEVYLWIEQDSSIMLKAVSEFGDPVELSSKDAKNLAKLLTEAAEKLDQL